MDTSTALVLISVAVLLSYWYLHLGRQLRFPAVVFLLLTGLALRAGADFAGWQVDVPPGLLPVLGTVGLILIVLEGALDLKLSPGRRAFLWRTFGAAALGVVVTAAAVALPVKYLFELSWMHAVLVAMPFAVISSAVAIPSAQGLSPHDREFVVYESSWSDILGVMLFNAALVAVTSGQGFTLNLVGGGLAVLLLGGLLGLGMIWLVGHLQGHVKFLPLIFALILVYGAAKALSLSPLLIVLVLGLMLNNPQLLEQVKGLRQLHSARYDAELDKLKHLTAEATFLVRTFFFLLLGFGTDLRSLVDLGAWGLAILLSALIFGLRWPLMRLLSGSGTRPLAWAAPRGLITVLLFFSIPPQLVPAGFPVAALILLVLISCIAMAVGFRIDGPQPASGQVDAAAPPGDPAAEAASPPSGTRA
ncbi:MAG: cation:proton antiporter [Rubrivivax sp.]